ncbi:MAG: signal peptide peptidase SppA [Hyphomonadaceae bacterium]|nr:signal peptide peptidase SppA [Hyphomonadaceae bacterium]
MRTFLLTFLGGLAALVVFFVLIPLVLIMSFVPSGEPPRVRNAVLEIDLREGLADQPAADAVNSIFSGTSFVETLLRLNAAADDPDIKGVFVRAAEMNLGSSRAEELRTAFLRLRAKDKFVIAHSQGFLASGPAAYRAISAANEIWLQPGTNFEAPGITFETMFLGGAMEKLKVSAEIEQFYEFKGAADVYKQTGYTPANATAMTALATSVWTHSLADIAADRKIDPVTMRALLEASPYQAQEAADLKLVDRLGYPEEAASAAEKLAGGKLLPIGDYHPSYGNGKAVIAIVGGEGDIVTGGGGPVDILSLGTPVFASDRVAKQLLEIVDDESVNAVVFRIDSGGGSATASDQIWSAVKKVQASGKKVVVSMGSMAASGGYYSAASADAIIASRSTITGSIGVFGGKFAIADGLRQFGINPDSVSVGGEFASAYSTEKLTLTQRTKLLEGLQATYDRFTGIVAEGRKMPLQKVQEVARGRVWSGEDALRLGLIDKTGDIITALEEARTLAGFKPEDGMEIRMNIQRSSPFDLLTSSMMQAKAGGAAELQIAKALGGIIGDKRAMTVINQLRQVGQSGSGTSLWSPPVMER